MTMTITTNVAWATLILIHILPAMVLVRPSLISKLYGVSASGQIGILLVHRGALFLAVILVCAYALFEPSARRPASLVAATSIIGFLAIYGMSGLPQGPLRSIALADMIGLIALIIVLRDAW